MSVSETTETREATALFNYRAVREIGSLAAALGGLDALVFTGGIGEHDAETRAAIVEACGWLGARLDAARNELGRDASAIRTSQSMSGWCQPTRSA